MVQGWSKLRAHVVLLLVVLSCLAVPSLAFAQAAPAAHGGGEANLVLPDLGQVAFSGIDGRTLLMAGLVVAAFGLAFGLVIYRQLQNLPRLEEPDTVGPANNVLDGSPQTPPPRLTLDDLPVIASVTSRWPPRAARWRLSGWPAPRCAASWG